MQKQMKQFVNMIPEYLKPRKHLLEYKRDKQGRKTGVVVAFKTDADIHVGWSLYNHKAESKNRVRFNRELGIAHALRHAQKISFLEEDMSYVAHSIRPLVQKMMDRALLYFNRNLREPKSDRKFLTQEDVQDLIDKALQSPDGRAYFIKYENQL